MSVSLKVTDSISSYFFQLDSTSDVEEKLISSIFAAAVEDFMTMEEETPYLLAMERAEYGSKLHVAVSGGAARLVRNFPQLKAREADVVRRIKTLKKYMSCFEPAIYEGVRIHFESKGAREVSFRAKLSVMHDKQVGTMARVTEKGESRSRLHFIKSTRPFFENGRDFDHVTLDRAEFLDYKELFVYRVLEKLGLGPKVEFILVPDVIRAWHTGSQTGVVISTQDLSTVNQSAPTDDGLSCSGVNVSAKVDEGEEDERVLFSSFHDIVAAKRARLRAEGMDHHNFLQQSDRFVQELFFTPIARRDLKTIDLLCRVLHLDDVLTNNGSFGRVVDAASGEEIGWKVVDFKIVPQNNLQDSASHYLVPALSTQFVFVEVGGRLYYATNPALRQSLLYGTELGKEVKEELLHGNSVHPPLITVLENVWSELVDFLEANKAALAMEEKLHQRKLKDLMEYARAVCRFFLKRCFS